MGAVMPVSIRPGQMALHRMEVPDNCQQAVCIREITAALEAE
jgi:hypothetical protein